MPNDWSHSGLPERSPEPVSITVVIPHYNHAHILPRAVCSVLAEGMPGVEIIIVDDGSTEPCEAILNGLEQAHPCLRVIRCQANQGAPVALNVGLAEAKGQFICFLGADDLLLPGFMRTMRSALLQNPDAALACGDIAIVSTDSHVLGIRPFTAPAWSTTYLPPAEVRRRIMRTDNWICNTATLHRTAVVKACGGFDPSLGAFCDGILCRLLAFTHGFVYVTGVYGIWQVAGDTLSASSILNSEKLAHLIDTVEQRLAGSVVGATAPEYLPLYLRRLRMSAVRMRLAWNAQQVGAEDLFQVAHADALDRRAVGLVQRTIGFGRLGSAVLLGWFAARLRPFGPGTLLAHWLRNQGMLWRNAHRVRQQLHKLNDTAHSALRKGVTTGDGAGVR